MGIQDISGLRQDSDKQHFIRALLTDLQALEQMIRQQRFETGVTRIGAEQEMFLVDAQSMKLAPINQDILEAMGHPNWLKPELARFNLETNLSPQNFHGSCLRDMENEGLDYLQQVRAQVQQQGAECVLTGVLPTLNRHDLAMRNLTPVDRYQALLDATKNLMPGDHYRLHISGIDELVLKHESSLLPASSNSFQVHLQVSPEDFAAYYNLALLLAAPVMAVSVNSPLLFGKRLWHESRMILYQQASDTRTPMDYQRERSARVQFAERWLEHSVAELYQEDISHYPVLLGDAVEEDSLAVLAQGGIPQLKALQIHNSTVYRWNRPCYGISPNGQPHLRIENRYIPAGPTVIDQMANAAFWLGLMVGMKQESLDVREHIELADVQDNFWKAARHGIGTEMRWLDQQRISVRELVLDQLLPMAERGLQHQAVDEADIQRYLAVIKARVETGQTGARWMLSSYNRVRQQESTYVAQSAVVADTISKQWALHPVHAWEHTELKARSLFSIEGVMIEDFMQTRFYSVHPSDPVELARAIMDWKAIDYLAVEDHDDHYMGLIHRDSITTVSGKRSVREYMLIDTPIVTPQQALKAGVRLMQTSVFGCLPVVEDGKLQGILCQEDLEGVLPSDSDASGVGRASDEGMSRQQANMG